ncbi:MAG: TonB-dependent receptor [Flavobacteriaceae bacterium]|nr:TonB-dependent receptor [Flavobacteriaceae bacterium]
MGKLTKYILVLLVCLPLYSMAQSTVNGIVIEKSSGLPLPGVNILVKGTTTGTFTDFEGNFSIEAETGQILVFSYVGYKTQELTVGSGAIRVVLEDDMQALSEVVVIGYGTTNKKDATGSVSLLKAEELNKGAIVSADQMLNGKSVGVRIVNNGGQPDSDPNIRIRGGSSLSASNSPLIVIDGIPISNTNPAGQANPLQLVNPNDIESFSILKDASSTAIYGSRASNGVIIITTKKGSSGKLKYNYNSNVQIGTLSKKLDVVSSADYVGLINNLYPTKTNLLGLNGEIYNTNWQDEIYRTSFSTDHNFSVTGNIKDVVPFRTSLGYTKSEGILIGSQVDRYTLSLNATPFLLDEHLKVTLTAKGVLTRKDQPDEGAIGSALTYNPTLPIYDPNGGVFGGYHQIINDTGINGPSNPLALLNQRERNEDADRFLGSLELNYKMPWLPELRAIVNAGVDYSSSDINEMLRDNAVASFVIHNGNEIFNTGETYREEQTKTDRTLDAYLSYTKNYEQGLLKKIDAQAGYSYQNFKLDGTKYPTKLNETTFIREADQSLRYFSELNLQSFFGRVNIDLANKYLLTASLRADGSSLFSEDNRWGYFPAVALAWKMKQESFLENATWVNDMKLRLGWGITGQQDVTGSAGYYPYTALYREGVPQVSYILGGVTYTTYRANPFNPDLTWETTKTFNVGLDYELFGNVLSGSIDYYKRNTSDLLAEVPQPEGALKNRFVDNVGETESEGVELGMVFTPIKTEDLTVEFNGNISFNETFITELNKVTQVAAGGNIGRGTGIEIFQHAVGNRASAFWLFEQVYDQNGKPIEDAFVDQNGDNVITDADRVFTDRDPKWTYGFGTNINYKRFDFSANFRGQIGGNLYNANLLNRGFAQAAVPLTGEGYITNLLDLYDGTNYNGFMDNVSDNQALSDFYLSDATFMRLDNVTLGYKFKKFMNDKVGLRMYASVNNVFVITDYDGLDPENFGGIEESPYARPRTYTFGINLDF